MIGQRCLWQGEQAAARGGPFAVLNGAVARDVLCVLVPPGVAVPAPIHVLHVSSGDPTQPAVARCAAEPHRFFSVGPLPWKDSPPAPFVAPVPR
jgi:hypothetical protein